MGSHICSCGQSFLTTHSLDLHFDKCDSWRPGGIPDGDGFQTCKNCRVRKPTDDFPRHSSKKSGYGSRCRACIQTRREDWYSKNQESVLQKAKIRYRENRETLSRESNDRYWNNRDRILSQKKIYSRSVSEVRKKYMKEYNSIHRKDNLRGQKKSRSATIGAVLDFLGPFCADCGSDEKEFLTVDHVHSDGNRERYLGSLGWKRKILSGEFPADRYRVLCHDCNIGKYISDPIHQRKEKPLTGSSKFCPTCSMDLDESLFHSNGLRGQYYECKYCESFRRAVLRQRAISHLGGFCVCCKQSEPHKLSFDHLYSDGSERRKASLDTPGESFYREILTGARSDIQLLCRNCNFSKHQGAGVCVHKRSAPGPVRRDFSSIRVPQNLIDFDPKAVEFRVLTPAESKLFFDSYHYIGFGRSSVQVIGAYLGPELIAAAKFSHVVRKEVATKLGFSHDSILELDRFCIHPERHRKNFGSYCMSHFLQILKSHFRLAGVVSFADPAVGHDGTLYRASNWKPVGLSTSSYYYVDESGKTINKKTLFDTARRHGMKEREYADKLRLSRVRTPPKMKFWYPFEKVRGL